MAGEVVGFKGPLLAIESGELRLTSAMPAVAAVVAKVGEEVVSQKSARQLLLGRLESQGSGFIHVASDFEGSLLKFPWVLR